MLLTAMRYSHLLLKEILQPGDSALDATMGNGNDTALLAELVGTNGHVYGFDLQALAVENTKKRLAEKELLAQSQLYLKGHETIDQTLAEDVQLTAAIFNLGYLPKSDKNIITLPETTEIALTSCLRRLKSKGRLIIVAYYGHPGGPEELATVENFCENLPQEQFNVLKYQFINQKNSPPILFCVEKK